LTRQLLIESVLLAAVGAAGGLAVAVWLFDGLVAQIPARFQPVRTPEVDYRVLSFAIVTTVLATIFFGLPTALQLSRPNLRERFAGATKWASLSATRFRSLLIAGETAIALLLIVTGGLIAHSFIKLNVQDTGFADPHRIVVVPVALGAPGSAPAPSATIVDDLLARIRTMPDISGAAMIGRSLFSRGYPGTRFIPPSTAKGFMIPSDAEVSASYFDVMRIRIVAGRGFDDVRDRTEPVVVMSQSLAAAFWPGQNPVGRQLATSDRTFHVIGVAADTRDIALDQPIAPNIYRLHVPSSATTRLSVVVRTQTRAADIGAALRAAIGAADPTAIVEPPRSLADLMARSIAERRFNLLVFGVFAAAGVLVAAIGIFAVVAYSIGRRVHEIGIRLALGATSSDIIRLVSGSTLTSVAAGAAAGLVCALMATRLLNAFLYGLSPTDPLTLILVTLTLGVVSLAAAIIPARRALRINPVEALRTE
jgi:predicted permease